MSDKTEEPSHKKLENARKQGQLPQRKNILEVFVIVSGLLGISTIWELVKSKLFEVFDGIYYSVEYGFDQSLGDVLWSSFDAVTMGVILSLAMGLGLLILNLLLTKFNFAPASLTPKFEKFNPVNALKGIFSKNTLYNFIRLLIFFTAVSAILFISLDSNIVNGLNAAACGLICLAQLFPSVISNMIIQIVLVLIILAIIDFKLQNMMFISQNKMSKDELKREYKSSEGDPMIKGMRKQIAHQDLYLPSPRDVTHVIYSNSHLIAILYKDGITPFVVMKAKGKSVPSIQSRFRAMGVRCVNLPAVAVEFHKKYAVSRYMDANSARGMAKVLKACRQM